jgi:hypothetical protein
MRPWTPNTRLANGGVRMSVKRTCDGCHNLLGDTTDEELVDATYGREGRPLLSATAECGHCQGLHVLFAKPEPVDEGQELVDGDWTIGVICPGIPEGTEVLPCAAYEPCGCPAPADPLTVEFQEFLKQHCPVSPTGEHRWLSESGFVGAPTGGCWFRLSDRTPEAAAAVVTGPGMYPVDAQAFDDVTPEYQLVDLATYRKAATPA